MRDRALKVLLVDDDEEDFLITRDLFREIEDTRYELDWVETFDEALGRILERTHDIYLLDYHLGAHDGLELLRAALEGGVREPMIMLTGQGGRQVDLEASRAGAYDYLVKGSITAQVLERSVRYALQHARSVEALRSTVRLSGALVSALGEVSAAVMISDPLKEEHPLVYVNPAFTRLTGYARGDVLGKNPRLLQGPRSNTEELDAMREAIAHGERYQGHVINYKKSGEPFLCDLTISPVHDNSRRVVHFVAVMRALDVEV